MIHHGNFTISQYDLFCKFTLKILPVINMPMTPVNLNRAKHDLRRSVVTVAIVAQKKICQANFTFQNDDSSSMQKRRAPTGALNAAATPAAAPALMKLRLQWSKAK